MTDELKIYVVEYLPENETDVQTLFVLANSPESAKDKILYLGGAFTNVLSINLSKSDGGPGKTIKETVDEEIVQAPVKQRKVKEPKPVKEKKVTYADRIRAQCQFLKEENRTIEELVVWAMENCGQTKGVARAYCKVIWNE